MISSEDNLYLLFWYFQLFVNWQAGRRTLAFGEKSKFPKSFAKNCHFSSVVSTYFSNFEISSDCYQCPYCIVSQSLLENNTHHNIAAISPNTSSTKKYYSKLWFTIVNNGLLYYHSFFFFFPEFQSFPIVNQYFRSFR